MGLTAERVARRYGVSREDQDAFALASHQKALAAQAAGRFKEEIVPVRVATFTPDGKPGKVQVQEREFSADEGPRADTSAAALAQLKPVFHAQGTVTAGNSSQTSDGAAAVVLVEAGRARELGLQPLARLVSYAVTGCLPEEMGIGPITAIPKALKLAGLTLNDIDLIELNEAFAAQVLAIMRALYARSCARERQRRRHCARPSAGLHRRKIDRDSPPRAERPEGPVRDGDDVRRRRHGGCGHL